MRTLKLKPKIEEEKKLKNPKANYVAIYK